ncbi:hypothetical protein RFI_05591 [Reticulomyxa filosa]|uniref:Uncharacterized protein n=1 Tax=Reticulomyxa filosa TaxID=46433 RepID=X6NZW3_RETFI|nr:hypothetical protein RFI_05591 [Reticulomyxa filosa]|eukprot:ETO31526.1 hypothetical protein RFI_05591 [Reticulomyxa filosa]
MYQYISQIFNIINAEDLSTTASSTPSVQKKALETELETTISPKISNLSVSAKQVDLYLRELFRLSNKSENVDRKLCLEDVETIVVNKLYHCRNAFEWLFEVASCLTFQKDIVYLSIEKMSTNDKQANEHKSNDEVTTVMNLKKHVFEIVLKYMFYCVARPQYMLHNNNAFFISNLHIQIS